MSSDALNKSLLELRARVLWRLLRHRGVRVDESTVAFWAALASDQAVMHRLDGHGFFRSLISNLFAMHASR